MCVKSVQDTVSIEQRMEGYTQVNTCNLCGYVMCMWDVTHG